MAILANTVCGKPANNNKASAKLTPLFPKLTEFFKKHPNIKKKYRMAKCEVETRLQENCLYRSIPKKGHCLSLKAAVNEMIPQYNVVLNNTELVHFRDTPVRDLALETCSKKVSFRTAAEGEFQIIPSVMLLHSVEADINIPIPLGDFQIFGDGVWMLEDYQMKIKFYKETPGAYRIKGAASIDFTPISQIGKAFNVDVVPRDSVGLLLQNLHIDSMLIRNCKVYGFIQPFSGDYQLIFTGSPDKREYSGGNVRVILNRANGITNVAVLLELQDYSPVTLLRKIYGPSIKKVNVLRDRNQTIALYVSAHPTQNFTNIVASHGTSRWIHLNSKFDAGATLLVTLPFPKRKAMDMKVQLHPDGLAFLLPENENLSGELALGAISPSKIVRVDKSAFGLFNDESMYNKLKILKFRYFIFNDTYLAAAESLASVEDELAHLMPKGDFNANSNLLDFLHSNSQTGNSGLSKAGLNQKEPVKDKLDAFFKRENKEPPKRNTDRVRSTSTLMLSEIEKDPPPSPPIVDTLPPQLLQQIVAPQIITIAAPQVPPTFKILNKSPLIESPPLTSPQVSAAEVAPQPEKEEESSDMLSLAEKIGLLKKR